jgi:hypothetical protein
MAFKGGTERAKDKKAAVSTCQQCVVHANNVIGRYPGNSNMN